MAGKAIFGKNDDYVIGGRHLRFIPFDNKLFNFSFDFVVCEVVEI